MHGSKALSAFTAASASIKRQCRTAPRSHGLLTSTRPSRPGRSPARSGAFRADASKFLSSEFGPRDGTTTGGSRLRPHGAYRASTFRARPFWGRAHRRIDRIGEARAGQSMADVAEQSQRCARQAPVAVIIRISRHTLKRDPAPDCFAWIVRLHVTTSRAAPASRCSSPSPIARKPDSEEHARPAASFVAASVTLERFADGSA
jgi:hypothetical protein